MKAMAISDVADYFRSNPRVRKFRPEQNFKTVEVTYDGKFDRATNTLIINKNVRKGDRTMVGTFENEKLVSYTLKTPTGRIYAFVKSKGRKLINAFDKRGNMMVFHTKRNQVTRTYSQDSKVRVFAEDAAEFMRKILDGGKVVNG